MAKLSGRVESVVSILILVCSGFISGFLVHEYFFPPTDSSRPTQEVDKPFRSISRLDLEKVNWSAQSKTLILALQASCHFCNESAPFYKRLIEIVKGRDLKLIAVLPSDIKESKAHLDKLGLIDLDVRQASLDSIQVDGTPTLLLVNNNGQVIDHWVGKLTASKEAEVIKSLIPES